MINSQCGYQNVSDRPRLYKQGGCGRWVGFLPVPCPPYLPITPREPHVYKGIAWCEKCVKGFQIWHLGQGVFVRPRDEGDKQPAPAGSKLEDLY